MTNFPSQRLGVLTPLLQHSFFYLHFTHPFSGVANQRQGRNHSIKLFSCRALLRPRKDAGRSRLSTQELIQHQQLLFFFPSRGEKSVASGIGIHEMLFIPDSPMQLSRFAAGLLRVQLSPLPIKLYWHPEKARVIEWQNSFALLIRSSQRLTPLRHPYPSWSLLLTEFSCHAQRFVENVGWRLADSNR